ncbi:MAG: tRNA (5-methylaminomethyl-2-thiouridine)(34)-methyltransferase MnmD [Bacteroidia bacterium]
MQREIITTADGSKTIQIVDWNEQYHSVHGAIQEAMHIYITAGLLSIKKQNISILEMGFGTGLNCFLTLEQALKNKLNINYTGIEAYPVTNLEHKALGYAAVMDTSITNYLSAIETCNWNDTIAIHPSFLLHKVHASFEAWLAPANTYDLIYFDAFSPNLQPELWTTDMFNKMFRVLKPNGVLITYCAKGQVKRNLKETGFTIESLPGPVGKREITRAHKQA